MDAIYLFVSRVAENGSTGLKGDVIEVKCLGLYDFSALVGKCYFRFYMAHVIFLPR
ncbi:MAG: hypothetical protein ACI9HG_000741 [Flavobacteriales bacterium]|jgi:hypothetical protein